MIIEKATTETDARKNAPKREKLTGCKVFRGVRAVFTPTAPARKFSE